MRKRECAPGARLRLALVDGLGARVVLPGWAGARGAFLVPSGGDGLGRVGRPAVWTGRLLLRELGWGCARGRDEGGLWRERRRRHGTGLLLRGLVGIELGILVCGAVWVVRGGGWLSRRIGRLAASQLLDEVFDRLSLWVVERCEGRRGPRVLVGAGGGGGRGLLLYGVCVGREGIEGGDELEHGLARGRRGRLGDGERLGWRGQLPGRLLGDIGVCRVVGFGWRLLDGGRGGREGLGVGVGGSRGGAVKGVSKEGIKVVPGGHGGKGEEDG